MNANLYTCFIIGSSPAQIVCAWMSASKKIYAA
jgi:hypothetical protein